MSKLAQTILSTNAVVKETNLALDILSADADLVVVDSGLSLVTPANGETGVALQPPFSWADTESRGLYRLSYSTSANLTGATVVWTENTSYTPPSNLASGTYYWKVESYDVTQEDVLVPDTPTAGMVVWDANTQPAPIYVYQDESAVTASYDGVIPRVLEAANDLADYIVTSSGKSRPSVQVQPDSFNFPQRCIKVGYPNSLTGREEIQIKCSAGGPIELTGVDEYDPDNPDWLNPSQGGETDSEYMSQAGSYHSVMTFLHDNMGIVWGWIGDIGEAVPSLSELNVDVVDYTHTPSCVTREFLRFSSAGNASPYGLAKDIQKRWRNFWSLKFNTGHEMKRMFDLYYPEQDEIFALQPGNVRTGFPGGTNAKMETGSTLLDDNIATQYLPLLVSENPLKSTFDCEPTDAYFSGHSRDPRALALDYRDPSYTPRFPYRYEGGVTINDVPITDREVKFANRLLERVRQEPGYEDFLINTAAYGPTRWAPQEAPSNDNVYIANIANDFSDPTFIDTTTGQTHRQNFDDWLAWSSKKIHLWRPNMGNGYGHIQGLPLCQVGRISTRFKTIVDGGVTGFLPDNFWEHWSTQWPMYYLMGQLLWDHTQDVETLMNKAYNTLFGNAATHIKAYYEYIETVLDSDFQHRTSYTEIPDYYTQGVLDTLQGHIDLAISATTAGTPERLRAEWVEAGFEWTKGMVQACNYFIEYNAPAVAVDGATNIATNSNAIEDDTDAITGWTPVYGGDNAISQSDDTNGSSFAFLLDNTDINCNAVKRDDILPGTPETTGTATSGSANTLTDTGQAWTIDEHIGKELYIHTGSANGQRRTITSNTSDTLTVGSNFGTDIDSTSEYIFYYEGTATSGTRDTLTDTGQSWDVDELVGECVRIYSGTNQNEYRTIISNTADTITVNSLFSQTVDATSSYRIHKLYLVEIDGKFIGEGERWQFDCFSEPGRRVYINPEDTDEYKTLQTAGFSGEKVRIRQADLDQLVFGSVIVDNLKIFEADSVDKVDLANTWTTHNSQFTSAVFASKWEGSQPIGDSVAVLARGRVPTPESSDITDPDPGLE